MHNQNVVKDEIQSRNYFQLGFVTESHPLRVLLSLGWRFGQPWPQAKVNLAYTHIICFPHSMCV